MLSRTHTKILMFQEKLLFTKLIFKILLTVIVSCCIQSVMDIFFLKILSVLFSLERTVLCESLCWLEGQRERAVKTQPCPY